LDWFRKKAQGKAEETKGGEESRPEREGVISGSPKEFQTGDA